MKATKIDGEGEKRVLGAVAGLRYKTLQIVPTKLLWGLGRLGLDEDYEGLSNVSTAIPTKKEQLPNL